MKNLYKLINYSWNNAKLMFEHPVETKEDFSRLIQIGNEAVKSVESERDKNFVRAVIVAVIDYIEYEWRQKRK